MPELKSALAVTSAIVALTGALTAPQAEAQTRRGGQTAQRISPQEKAESLYLLQLLALDDRNQQLANLPGYSTAPRRQDALPEAPPLKKYSNGERVLANVLDSLGRKTGIDVFGDRADEINRQNRDYNREQNNRIKRTQRETQRQRSDDNRAITRSERKINSDYLRVTTDIKREITRMVKNGEISAGDLLEAREAAIKAYENAIGPVSQNDRQQWVEVLDGALAVAESQSDKRQFTTLTERQTASHGNQLFQKEKAGENPGFRVIIEKNSNATHAERVASAPKATLAKG